jgi:glyoxylase I family protein
MTYRHDTDDGATEAPALDLRDVESFGRWYAQHLGVRQPPASYEGDVWEQQAGPTVFAPIGEANAAILGGAGWGMNFRVGDLDAMVRQLQEAGIEVDVDPQEYPNGRFAQLRDPEGNAVQLWEPFV